VESYRCQEYVTEHQVSIHVSFCADTSVNNQQSLRLLKKCRVAEFV